MKKIITRALSLIIISLIIPTMSFLNQEDLQVELDEISISDKTPDISTEVSPNVDKDKDTTINNSDKNTTQTLKVYFHESDTVKEMSMLDYITGVVLAEMPASFSEEALKAQTVIAHTYTLKTMATEKENPTKKLQGADISTDYRTHQAFCTKEEYEKRQGSNFEESYKKVCNCVSDVFGEILTYDEEPIIATFHAMSSGVTESAENVWGFSVPYLVATESKGDLLSPTYETEFKLTKSEVENLIAKSYPDVVFNDEVSKWLKIENRTDSGYVDKISILNLDLTGQDVRELFSLRSADFDVSYKDGVFTFEVLGYGHGVGLSQYGADYLAKQGDDYKKILAHYYPNTVLSEV